MKSMTLKEVLFNDFKDAMKQKDTLRKNIIQSVRTAVLQVEKDKQIELDDQDVLGVISDQVKKRKSALPEYEKSDRKDLVDELKLEIEMLMAYLPKQLTEDEITEIVKSTVASLGATSMKDMGKVMAQLTPVMKGKADNQLVSQIVKKILV